MPSPGRRSTTRTPRNSNAIPPTSNQHVGECFDTTAITRYLEPEQGHVNLGGFIDMHRRHLSGRCYPGRGGGSLPGTIEIIGRQIAVHWSRSDPIGRFVGVG